jgi:hypothetical protein
MKRFICFLVGHEWMRNGLSPLRVRGQRLGSSPDWQTCSRCGQWELLA